MSRMLPPMPPPPPPPPASPSNGTNNGVGGGLGAEFMNMSWSAHLSPLPPLFMGGIGLFGTGDDPMAGNGHGGMGSSPLGISIGGNGAMLGGGDCDEIDADPIMDRTTVTSSGGLGDWPGSGRKIPPPPPSPDPIAAALPVLNGGSHRMGAGTRATGAAVTWNVAPPGTVKTDRVTKIKHETPVASPPGRKRRARVARMAAGTACVVCHTQKTKCDGRRPCGRCVRLHREERCVDREGKHSHAHAHDKDGEKVKTEKKEDDGNDDDHPEPRSDDDHAEDDTLEQPAQPPPKTRRTTRASTATAAAAAAAAASTTETTPATTNTNNESPVSNESTSPPIAASSSGNPTSPPNDDNALVPASTPAGHDSHSSEDDNALTGSELDNEQQLDSVSKAVLARATHELGDWIRETIEEAITSQRTSPATVQIYCLRLRNLLGPAQFAGLLGASPTIRGLLPPVPEYAGTGGPTPPPALESGIAGLLAPPTPAANNAPATPATPSLMGNPQLSLSSSPLLTSLPSSSSSSSSSSSTSSTTSLTVPTPANSGANGTNGSVQQTVVTVSEARHGTTTRSVMVARSMQQGQTFFKYVYKNAERNDFLDDMPVAILRIARDRFFASLVQLTSQGVRALPSPRQPGSTSSSASVASAESQLMSFTAGNDPDFHMESPSQGGGRAHSFGTGPGPTMHLTVLVNREYERLLGFTQREIQNRVESLGGKTIWRLVHLSECKQLTQLSLRAILGIEPDFRMAISMRNKWNGIIRVLLTARYDLDADRTFQSATFCLSPMPPGGAVAPPS